MIAVTHYPHGGVVLSDDDFRTVANGDRLQEVFFLQNKLPLAPDLELQATRSQVWITRKQSRHTCCRADFIDVIRGLKQSLHMREVIE